MIKAMLEKRKLVWLIIALDVLVVAVIVILVVRNRSVKQTERRPQPAMVSAPVEPTKAVLPTKTPTEIKIISQIETKTVEIKNGAFAPADAAAKVHDQIQWQNRDTVDHWLADEDWGSPLALKPGRVFTQSFDKPGTYRYSCKLHPEEKGTITIK
jgi:plastocyanin